MSEGEKPLRNNFNYFDYDWSEAFLARMEKDPNWPPWIPAKSEPSK